MKDAFDRCSAAFQSVAKGFLAKRCDSSGNIPGSRIDFFNSPAEEKTTVVNLAHQLYDVIGNLFVPGLLNQDAFTSEPAAGFTED